MKRLFESGLVTTMIGVVIIVLAGSLWGFTVISTTEFVEGSAIGFIFLRSKDSLIGLSSK